MILVVYRQTKNFYYNNYVYKGLNVLVYVNELIFTLLPFCSVLVYHKYVNIGL